MTDPNAVCSASNTSSYSHCPKCGQQVIGGQFACGHAPQPIRTGFMRPVPGWKGLPAEPRPEKICEHVSEGVECRICHPPAQPGFVPLWPTDSGQYEPHVKPSQTEEIYERRNQPVYAKFKAELAAPLEVVEGLPPDDEWNRRVMNEPERGSMCGAENRAGEKLVIELAQTKAALAEANELIVYMLAASRCSLLKAGESCGACQAAIKRAEIVRAKIAATEGSK